MPHQPRPDLAPSTRALLDAVLSISSDLDLSTVLSRIVTSATELTHARYGALGVIGPNNELVEFVTTGLSDAERVRIGALPHGRGLLGLLIERPDPVRVPKIEADPRSAGFPDNHPPMESFLGVPVRIRGTVFGNLYLTEKAWDEPFTDEDEVLVSALADVAGFVVENARAYGLSEQRRGWLEASAQLTDASLETADVQRVAEHVARTTRSATGALGVAVLTASTEDHVVIAAPEHRERVAAALSELEDDAGLDGRPGALSSDTPSERRVAGLRARVLPLRTKLVDRSALVVIDAHAGGPLDVEERELLLSFADQAALTLDRVRALAEREELAVISDRERIARDLHDVVIQRLFATGLQLQGISMTADSPDLTARLSAAADELNQTIKDIRGTIFELQHQRSDSLRTAVRDLAREYDVVLGFAPRVSTRGPVDSLVSPEVAQHLLTVAREGLSNVARHARATSATLEVSADGDGVELRVTDDGVGLAEAADRGVESGLRNARARADHLGGRLDLAPAAERGTVLTWRAPLG